ncbi:MAG: ribonuclease HII [Flavobacteriales bacterium]|nr:ribonuclease HII [Flavobacteriales bacterium]
MLERSVQYDLIEVGCDEAGRGCLAGPVVAAAVILDPNNPIEGLNDSKQLSERRRDLLRPEIERLSLAWAVGIASNQEIDRINILKASFLAMHRAIDQLKVRPELIAVDGNRFTPYADVPHVCMVKGDARFMHIAAASILAKTHRDEIMQKLHSEYPNYGWDRNKGYPTKEHRQGIRQFGATHYHRLSFTLLMPELPLR